MLLCFPLGLISKNLYRVQTGAETIQEAISFVVTMMMMMALLMILMMMMMIIIIIPMLWPKQEKHYIFHLPKPPFLNLHSLQYIILNAEVHHDR